MKGFRAGISILICGIIAITSTLTVNAYTLSDGLKEEEELSAYERRINKEIENGMYSKTASCDNIEMLVVPGYTDYLLQYAETVKEYKPNRVAFIFFDGDDIPDLLMDTEGKYSLYTYAGGQPTKVLMNMQGDDADAWVQREEFDDDPDIYYMPFDYIPYKCMTRVCFNYDYNVVYEDYDYDGYYQYTRNDSITTYNRYCDWAPITELCNNNNLVYMGWCAYYAGNETDNYTYQLKRLELGYNELVSCEYMYYSLAEAYLNIGREPEDAMTVFDRYINNGGMDQYMQHVSQFYYGDISEFFDRHIDFTDFDDDGETEMVIKHYMGSTDYYEAIGDEAVCVMHAGSGTADATDLCSDGFRTLIFRGDVTHVGREVRYLAQLDRNGCIIDVTTLHWLSNTGNGEYRSDDQYSYDKVKITRELYRMLVNYYSRDLLHPVETMTSHDILYKYPGVGGENREKLIADEKKIYMIEHAAGDTKASENSSQNAKTVSVKVDKELAENFECARLWVWQDRSHEDDQPEWDICICVTDDVWLDEETLYAKIPETIYLIENASGESDFGTVFECGRDESGIEYYIAGEFGASSNKAEYAGFVEVHFKVNDEYPNGYLTDLTYDDKFPLTIYSWEEGFSDNYSYGGFSKKKESSSDWIFKTSNDEAALEDLNPYNMTRIVRYNDGSLRDEWETGRPMNYGHIDVSDGFEIKAMPMEEAIGNYNPMYILLAFDTDGNQYQYRVYE